MYLLRHGRPIIPKQWFYISLLDSYSLRAGEDSLRKIFHQFIREEETNMKENMDEAKLSSIKNLKVKIPDHS